MVQTLKLGFEQMQRNSLCEKKCTSIFCTLTIRVRMKGYRKCKWITSRDQVREVCCAIILDCISDNICFRKKY